MQVYSPIDPAIVGLVERFNQLGLQTQYSCSGHLCGSSVNPFHNIAYISYLEPESITLDLIRSLREQLRQHLWELERAFEGSITAHLKYLGPAKGGAKWGIYFIFVNPTLGFEALSAAWQAVEMTLDRFDHKGVTVFTPEMFLPN